MTRHIVINGVEDAVRARLEAYWEKKLPRLQKLLTSHNAGPPEIRLTVCGHQKKGQRAWYEIRASAHLPTKTLAVEASDEEPHAAIDRVVDLLIAEVKRHNDGVHKDDLHKRKTRRAALGSAEPRLQQEVRSGHRPEFFQFLRPLLGFLRDHARRELRILELQGVLHPGEISVDDLVDEVLIRAWHGFEERPRDLALELWLTELLHQAIEELAAQEPRPHETLEEPVDHVPPEDVPPVEAKQEREEREWWDDLDPFEQTILLEDVIPDPESSESWDKVEPDEQRDRLLSLLGKLPPAQRQAFLLKVLEGYEADEIAMLQHRPKSEVKADIEAARRTLRGQLRAGEKAQPGAKQRCTSNANAVGKKK